MRPVVGRLSVEKGCERIRLTILPAGLAFFFTFMTVTEGGGRRAILKKFEEVYLPALKANFLVWPMVQFINFRMMPIRFQIVSSRPRLPLNVLADTLAAVCFDHWYLLDSLPVHDELIGRIGRQPQLTTLNDGGSICMWC